MPDQKSAASGAPFSPGQEPATGRNIAGAEYVDAITTSESDRSARTAFCDLVLELTRPGQTIFDFGAGPGLDARFYAERGYKVAAYDVDPQMTEYFATYCHDFIASGAMTLHTGEYAEFLHAMRSRPPAPCAMITANFAPLNLIDDLRELFATFAALNQEHGQVLVSMLSPYFIGDLRYRWWWRNASRLVRHGKFSVPGAQARIWRRRLSGIARDASPYFTLERVFPGTLPLGTSMVASGVDAMKVTAWLRLTRCRFMFLLFRRCQGPAVGAREGLKNWA